MKNNDFSFDKKRKIRNDLILAAVIVAIAAVCLLFLNITKVNGNSVVVKVDGEEIIRFSLSQNVEYDIITGKNNEKINTLVIKDGKASVTRADCPDGICKEYRPVCYAGETIVCLPHRIVIEITGEASPDGIDIAA